MSGPLQAAVRGSPLYLTVLTPSVTIGGQPPTVVFSGLGPGYSGLYQVDVQIPANAPSGDLPIVVSIGGNTSQKGVTVSVQ